MKVKEVMSKDPACCVPETKLQEITQMMADNDCGMIPVVSSKEDAKPAGTVTDRDIALRAFKNSDNDPRNMTAKDVMSSSVVTVSVDSDFDECCELMRQKQIRRVLVVDGDGRCCGIVSQSDVALNAEAKETAKTVEKISEPDNASAKQAAASETSRT